MKLAYTYLMQAGSVVVTYVSSPMATWTCLIMLLSIHLATNHAAVRAISMQSLNRQRANIVLSNFFDGKGILTPEVVSIQERIFEWDGVLRWRGSAPFAKARIGVPLQDILNLLAPTHHVTGAIRDGKSVLKTLIRLHKDEDFLVWYDGLQQTACIILKEGASPRAHLKAWALGLCAAHRFENEAATSATADKVLQLIESTLQDISNQWDDYLEQMTDAGWDVDMANLETVSGTRVGLRTESMQGTVKKEA